MAFQTAPGYNSLPNGNFSPTIYSKKVQLAFRTKSTVADITNSEYFGEISGAGDTVRIIKEPNITVSAYSRGKKLTPQDLDDEDFQMVIDKANEFSFKMDDIEELHSHVGFTGMASSKAGYELAKQHDMEVLGYMTGYKQSSVGSVADTVNDQVNGTKAVDTAGSDELLTSMKIIKSSMTNITTASAGDHSIPLGVRLPGATANPTAFATAYMVVSRMARLLDDQFVPAENRFLVISPILKELLRDEDSRFLNADWGASGDLRSGGAPIDIAGFKVYCSSHLPSVGTGPSTSGTANQNSNYGAIVAGHMSAVATADQMNKVESFRSQDTFADIVRGLHLYGRKILKPEALVTAKYNIA